MPRAALPYLILALTACGPAAAPAQSEEAPPSPVTSSLRPNGRLVLEADAASARGLLGPIAIESCIGYLDSHDGVDSCTWVTDAGAELSVKADGSATFTVDPRTLSTVGAWKAGSATLPFMIGATPPGVQLAWNHASRPEGVATDIPSVLQVTEEAPRAGLLLGTDMKIHGFTDGSAAPAAGLRKGDVIASLNGDAMTEAKTFISNLPKRVGKVARIGVTRNGEAVEVKLKMQPYWQCHRVWSATAVASVVEEPSGPAVAVACPPWAPNVVTAKK